MGLKYLTAGESHGPALCGILDGIPAGVKIAQQDFDLLMKKRWAGYGRGSRQRIESDQVEVLSGIVNGKTIGSPISLLIKNHDYQPNTSPMAPFSKENEHLAIKVPLPGHADFPGIMRYRFNDCRLVRERASARETAMRTALSLPARNLLQALDVRFFCLVESLGGIDAKVDYQQNPEELAQAVAESSDLFLTPDHKVCEHWREIIDKAQSHGKTLGGTAAVVFWNLPIGLGSYSQPDQRLDSRIAEKIMSIPGVKAVEFGFATALSRKDSSFVDSLKYDQKRGFYHTSNYAAGIEGGMTNGEPLIIRFHMKPLPGGGNANSVNLTTLLPQRPEPYRSDTQALQAAAVVAESVVALELADQILHLTGGADIETVRERFFRLKCF